MQCILYSFGAGNGCQQLRAAWKGGSGAGDAWRYEVDGELADLVDRRLSGLRMRIEAEVESLNKESKQVWKEDARPQS